MTADIDILVVDDRAEDRLAIEGMLRTPDYNVVTAASGTDALRRVLASDFAVILLDIRLPDIDGLEVARIIKQRERSRHTPVIFLTAADPDLGTLYKGYAVGAIDYLVKPIDADVLRAKTGIFVEMFRKDRRILAQAEALREADRRERVRELASVVLVGRRRYSNLAEAMPDIVWIAEPDGRITYTNRRWTEYTGAAVEVAREQGLAAVLHPTDAAAWPERWEAARHSECALDLECRVRRVDGQMRWHLCRAVPERDMDGKILAWLGTLTDNDDLHRACEAAESAVRARDAFLSLASHELRTPLTTLQLRLRSIERRIASDAQPPDADAVPRMVASALRQSDRLVRLVDDLLDVSRIATGRLTLHPEPFDLRELAYELKDRLQEAARDAGCTIEIHAPHHVAGRWDRLRLEQALQNLVCNALRYAPRAPIEISVEAAEGRAMLAVRDHGPGVPEEARARIFDRFERGSSTAHAEGLGLGLHIVREIASVHGGSIVVEAAPGGGASFVLTLPLEGAIESAARWAVENGGNDHGSSGNSSDGARSGSRERAARDRSRASAGRSDATG